MNMDFRRALFSLAMCTGSDLLSIICLRLVVRATVVAMIVVVIMPVQINVIQYDAENLRADILQLLFGASHKTARSLAPVYNQNHSINHRGNEHAVCKRSYRR